ncbi:MAG: O-antigen ligase family protein [Phycisphaerae bacterium]
MREKQISLDNIDVPSSRFDKVIESLLISLLAFMPLAFGAVEAWSEEVVLALAGAILVCFLLKVVFRKETNLVWSWAYIPVALFILIAVFQLIPLPSSAVSVISPSTASVKNELLGDLPQSAELLKSMTLSFYPNATKHNLRLILAVAAVFFVVVNVYRQAEQIKRLLVSISIIGGAIALLALAQDFFGNGKIYWIVPTGHGEAYSGPFINHSHYGQFVNLSIGAALGLIMVKVHEAFTGKRVTLLFVFEYLSSHAAKVIWFLMAIIILCAATVFMSLTHSGMVSMLIAAGFTTLVLSLRKSIKGRGLIMVLMALGAFICVLYIGFDAVYERLETLRQLHETEDSLWQILKDISLAWVKFPIFGTGLGTHEVAYPMFDSSTITALATHAENEYAQTVEETGLIGLITLVWFGIFIWINYVRNVRSAYTPIRSAAYGLGFGLLSIMLHSLSDFGQHLPANSVLSGIFCALLLALAHIEQKGNSASHVPQASRSFRSLRVVALVCVSGVWAWVLLGANSARLAEAHWKKALAVEQSLIEKDWQASDEEYIDLISNAATAADYQPDNVKYKHWLNVYRWKSISRVTNPNTSTAIIPEQAMKFARRIVDELHNARSLCPTYGATYCVVGQLEKFTLDDPNGAERIRKSFQLAPCDPTVCFVAGLLDTEEGHIDASFAKFSRAIQLDSGLFREVVDIYVNHIDRPDLAVMIAGKDNSWLNHVANILAESSEHQTLAEEVRSQVVELLKSRRQETDTLTGVTKEKPAP